MNSITKNNSKQGFTLLELLIVIAILAILATVVVLVLNPAETLRKSRDAQRISDLATVKTALGLYMTSVSAPYLGSTSANATCVGGGGTITIFLSTPTGTVTDAIFPTGFTAWGQQSAANSPKIDGTGWIPVNLGGLVGGSPISNFPLDPSNTPTNGTSVAGTITNDALLYRYACKASPLSFEINGKLESTFYTSTDNKLTKDGGNNDNLYETGTALDILPGTDDF